MAAFLALAAALAAAQPGAISAAALRARAAAAFSSGAPVAKAVGEADFAQAKAAAGRSEASALERDSFSALSAGLPLADAVQTRGGKADDVRRAAQLLGAEEAPCLCLYGGGPCPSGLTPVAPTGGGSKPLKGLATSDQVGTWITAGASTFELRQAESLTGGGSTGFKTAGSATRAKADAPANQLPAGFKTSAAAPPPLTPTDKAVNAALSPLNLEAYSRAGTVNKESKEGSRRRICGFLAKANWDPGEAWLLSKSARDAKGADPGDLDLRNAEHYLYAYSTTLKPSGAGDSVPAQTMLAVGWTPFKTITKYFRPTSTPSWDELTWGVRGATDGWRKPDWRKECAGYAKQ